jgi:ABC-2 type transport system permease protein
MTGFCATFRREFASLWLTHLAWILLFALVVLQGAVFVSIVATFAATAEPNFDVGPLQAFYGQSVLVPLTYLFLCPALTMRSFAEERRSGTIENLLSAPIDIPAIVLGKFAAALVTFTLLWLPSVAYPLILRQVVDIDWHTVATSYLGIYGLGAGLLAIGILCSVVARGQFIALILTTGVFLLFLFLGTAQYALDDGRLRLLFDQVAIQSQLAEMSQGIISLRRVAFDATLVALPLFLSTRIVGSWRWS